MVSGKYYNEVIQERLEAFVRTESWEGLTSYLDGLSHRDFRMAGFIMSERFMPRMDTPLFWNLFYALLAYDSKAFLMTMLKSVPLRRRQMGFSLCREDGYRRVAAYLNQCGTDIDRSKFISYMLGVFAEEVDELEFLLGSLHVDHPRERMHYLLRGEGLGCYYLLFKAMRQTEHDRDLLTGCCRFLMRKGDALSFNLASVAKVYFDLPQVKGSFSLKLDPYQLGRLEMSYASFRRVMQSI